MEDQTQMKKLLNILILFGTLLCVVNNIAYSSEIILPKDEVNSSVIQYIPVLKSGAEITSIYDIATDTQRPLNEVVDIKTLKSVDKPYLGSEALLVDSKYVYVYYEKIVDEGYYPFVKEGESKLFILGKREEFEYLGCGYSKMGDVVYYSIFKIYDTQKRDRFESTTIYREFGTGDKRYIHPMCSLRIYHSHDELSPYTLFILDTLYKKDEKILNTNIDGLIL